MIIGHGDIAGALIDRPDLCFFAAGVSNSNEHRWEEFQRERDLLYAQTPSKHLVYFSSLCMFYSYTEYAAHKRVMEMRVVERFPVHHTIIRLGNITWGTNPHTLINHLRACHAAGLPLDVQDVWRYVVDLDEFRHWMALIPDWSCEMNVPGRRMKVADIVREFVLPQWHHLGERAYV